MTARRFGDFELLRRVGRDGPFVLFRARQVSLDRVVTLKVLPERTRTLERAAVLRREAEAADRLDHSGVVRVYEVGDVGGTPYLAQAPVDGEQLSERLKIGPVSPRLALDLTRQLAEALFHAHERGVLHGSLRPEVVWVTRDGQARLAGFGCPALFESLDAEAVADWAGFLAPEQSGARGEIGRATDIYGLGALLYAMATGSPPHRGATVAETCRLNRSRRPVRPSRLHPGLPPALDMICARCLRAAPVRRFGPERQLARLIAELRRVDASRGVPEDRLLRWLRRHERLVRVAALVLLFAVVPALWDGQRHRAAWAALADPDAGAERHQSAAGHFERLAAEQPFAPEATAGMGLSRLRTGRGSPPAPQWRQVGSEWDAIQALTHVLQIASQGQRDEARAELQAARVRGYVPHTDIERRLLQECEHALQMP